MQERYIKLEFTDVLDGDGKRTHVSIEKDVQCFGEDIIRAIKLLTIQMGRVGDEAYVSRDGVRKIRELVISAVNKATDKLFDEADLQQGI